MRLRSTTLQLLVIQALLADLLHIQVLPVVPVLLAALVIQVHLLRVVA
jgi:hypothetical protein